MQVAAICSAEWRGATEEATGVPAVLSPPVVASNFDPSPFQGVDVWYIDLHGNRGQPFFTNDQGDIVLTDTMVRAMDLAGVTVFAVTCFLGDPESPMMDAFLDAGAEYVIAGEGPNYAPTKDDRYGAALLGALFIDEFERAGKLIPLAFTIAKIRVKFRYGLKKLLPIIGDGAEKADLDALSFHMHVREEQHHA